MSAFSVHGERLAGLNGESKSGLLAAVSDLFFSAKIQEAAIQLGIEVEFAKTAEAILDKARILKPGIMALDLNATRFNPIEIIFALRGEELCRTLPILGFYSHVNGKLRQDALAAGCTKVTPRSEFSAKLPTLLSELYFIQKGR